MSVLSPMLRLLIFAGLLVTGAGMAEAAFVRQFAPQGQVDQQIRATAVFNIDMVPLGRPDAPSPFDVDCGEVKGKARWGDAKSWSFTLDRPLQPGERCDFRLRTNFKAANGEAVSLGEYLEDVWAAVAKEALALVFEGADATGFEADARLTAMWLWTLKASDGSTSGNHRDDQTLRPLCRPH